jgi:hypothetical protein
MVRQAFDLLGHPLGSECLKHLDQTRMQPPSRRDSDQLKRLYRRRQALDRHAPQGSDAHQTPHQSPGGRGEQDGPRGSQLFHERRQMRVLAHRRVVHVQIVAI